MQNSWHLAIPDIWTTSYLVKKQIINTNTLSFEYEFSFEQQRLKYTVFWLLPFLDGAPKKWLHRTDARVQTGRKDPNADKEDYWFGMDPGRALLVLKLGGLIWTTSPLRLHARSHACQWAHTSLVLRKFSDQQWIGEAALQQEESAQVSFLPVGELQAPLDHPVMFKKFKWL